MSILALAELMLELHEPQKSIFRLWALINIPIGLNQLVTAAHVSYVYDMGHLSASSYYPFGDKGPYFLRQPKP